MKAVARYDKHFRIEINVDDWIQQQIFFFGIYDAPGINFIKKTLKPDDVFIDIGANIGIYSLSASGILQKERGGMVVAFEPVTPVFERLTENIKMNQADNIVPYRMAIFEKNTTLELFVSNRENLGMSSMFHHDMESGVTEKVKAVRLDDFMEQNRVQKVSLIKIDIEGAELHALRGMTKTIQQFRPVLMIEISENVLEGKDSSGREIAGFMNKLGYAPYTIGPSGDILPCRELTGRRETNYVFIFTE